MFTSKLLALTFSETWAVTQQSSGALRVPRHKVVVLRQLCHLAHTELMVGLWDTAQVFRVTPMKKAPDVGPRGHRVVQTPLSPSLLFQACRSDLLVALLGGGV